MKAKKIILVGAGAVGCSFLYSAMNRGLASEYGIIDVNKQNVEGQVLDFEDGSAPMDYPFNVFDATYKDCKDADIVVITAGRPQLPGETRLNMVEGNAIIMKDIAEGVKKSGFKGITVIASNPVDILTLVYQEVTGFDKKSIIGSGTSLDSARLTREISKRINIAPQSIQAYVMGEHGDSSVSAFSVATVGGAPLSYFVKQKRIDEKEFPKIHEYVWRKAYEIIDRKRATFYGIGVNLANICENIIRDSRKVLAVGAYLEGQYKNSGVYTGVPAVIRANGLQEIIELPISSSEQKQFDKSVKQLKEVVEKARQAIKSKNKKK
ncbi:L-lactate dehydrogenase [Metamycoplasma sualvi]|uniref:L-lactate dehydrogenase n=1 Tax=Metamycoplasma sualvi TaxID=2125 RepID=UPI003872C138